MAAPSSIIVTSALGEGELILRSMTMTDQLSRPFEIRLELLSLDFDLDFDKLLGSSLTVELLLPQDRKRYFNGIVAQFEFAGTSARFAVYQAMLRPWLWFLTHTSDCRIFQNQTVPEIIKAGVFRDKNFTDFEDQLIATYASREYCVQYRESDFNFASRLMEEEGIYYYFKHEQDKHTLVLCDSLTAHKTAEGYCTVAYMPEEDASVYQREGIAEWREAREVEMGTYVLTNYDFEKPKTSLEARSSSPASHSHADLEVFDYPGGYTDVQVGESYARIRREELQVPYQRYYGKGNPRGMGVGHLFTLINHPRSSLNKEYLVVVAAHELVSEEFEVGAFQEHANYRFHTEFETIDGKRAFRPARVTPKAIVRGPQTAVVVGPKQDEIYTDKYGRIKLKFHWDRHNKDDENASCWIRVAHSWAGKKWGQIFIPRIGQEVIVDFLEGDPDRPIVTGRVYNADQMPPYTLPGNQTQSTIKTRSATEGSDSTFNELRFEDKKGSEEIYFHAEKDFNRVVENNDTLKVGFEKKDEGNQTIEIHNNQKITIGNANSNDGSQTLVIWKNRTTTLEKGDDNLTLQTGNQTIKIQSGSQSTEAMQSITLKVGSNSITINQQGITIKGIQVQVQGTAKLDASSPLTSVAGSGTLSLQGALIKIN